ncbi:hypothetical protein D1BOALGB6SA_1007 [Olavius sp. associated proteobacterium Delta 1]|nr:hypothetical protein D1BOALGB6SA_1007 [Olavius sp. associated proteobacterium Delta 1]
MALVSEVIIMFENHFNLKIGKSSKSLVFIMLYRQSNLSCSPGLIKGQTPNSLVGKLLFDLFSTPTVLIPQTSRYILDTKN